MVLWVWTIWWRWSVLGGRINNQNCQTRNISTNIVGWEEKNPSRCATHSEFCKKPDICQQYECAYSVLEGFVQDGLMCDGLNGRSSDWNPIQVVRECWLDWMQQHHCSWNWIDCDSTRLEPSRFKPTRQDMMKLTWLGYGTRGWDALEKKDLELCKTKVWSNFFLNLV